MARIVKSIEVKNSFFSIFFSIEKKAQAKLIKRISFTATLTDNVNVSWKAIYLISLAIYSFIELEY
jgi:hypothetical protein